MFSSTLLNTLASNRRNMFFSLQFLGSIFISRYILYFLMFRVIEVRSEIANLCDSQSHIKMFKMYQEAK